MSKKNCFCISNAYVAMSTFTFKIAYAMHTIRICAFSILSLYQKHIFTYVKKLLVWQRMRKVCKEEKQILWKTYAWVFWGGAHSTGRKRGSETARLIQTTNSWYAIDMYKYQTVCSVSSMQQACKSMHGYVCKGIATYAIRMQNVCSSM